MSEPLDVVVIGGGIAGLAAAYELEARGLRFRLFERDERPGGVIRTERVDGFTIDTGPDAMLIQKPAAVQLCREIGLGDRLMPTEPPRTAFILREGTLYPLPESSVLGIPRDVSALAATRLFSMRGKARMAAEVFVPPRPPEAGDESIASFIGRRFGEETVTYLAEPLLAGIHAGDVDRLSMRALFPRFVQAEQKHGSLLRAFRQVSQPASKSGAFYSLPLGLEELVAALVEALPAHSLAFRQEVAAIDGRGPFHVRAIDGSSATTRAVIIATPAFVAGDLLSPFDPELGVLCRSVRYASSATIAFAYPRSAVRHPLLGAGFVVPRVAKTTIMAASWVSSKWAFRAPAGQVLLRAFVGGDRDPDAMARTDDDLVASAARELGAILGITGDPLFAWLQRWPRANAQHEVGHLDRMTAIENRLAALPGIFVTGSGFRGVGIPDCVADGRQTAEAIAARLNGR
jgi:oxygen-dependent protoporphyrinogen oxidase